MDSNGIRIFVVDDERVISQTLAIILKANGFEVEAFYLPAAALDAAEIARPDLLLSDVAMPGMTGFELAFALKTRHPCCKILLFSGHASFECPLPLDQQPETPFTILSKPLHPSILLAAIRTLTADSGHFPC